MGILYSKESLKLNPCNYFNNFTHKFNNKRSVSFTCINFQPLTTSAVSSVGVANVEADYRANLNTDCAAGNTSPLVS